MEEYCQFTISLNPLMEACLNVTKHFWELHPRICLQIVQVLFLWWTQADFGVIN